MPAGIVVAFDRQGRPLELAPSYESWISGQDIIGNPRRVIHAMFKAQQPANDALPPVPMRAHEGRDRPLNMKLTFLGTRGFIDVRTRKHRMHASLLVSHGGTKIVVDCGEDWLGRLDRISPSTRGGGGPRRRHLF